MKSGGQALRRQQKSISDMFNLEPHWMIMMNYLLQDGLSTTSHFACTTSRTIFLLLPLLLLLSTHWISFVFFAMGQMVKAFKWGQYFTPLRAFLKSKEGSPKPWCHTFNQVWLKISLGKKWLLCAWLAYSPPNYSRGNIKRWRFYVLLGHH